MLSVLKKYWGYDDFRPLQQEIITSVLDGRDTLGLLPTGGGKSLTFQVPALMLDGLTIVVTPLISLMKDQVDNLRALGIRAYCLHSGLSRSEARLVADRCRLGKTKILYVSPERLQSQRFIDELRHWDVSLIVVDEAHCISQWGYDFRPSYLRIKELRKIFPQVNVLALTASATPEVAADIIGQLEFRPGYRQFVKSFDRSNLSYIVRYDDVKERTLLRVLAATSGTAIVYVRSRRRCREIAQMLNSRGISADYYHAGLDPRDKEERQNAWKSDTVRVMVATNAFGMGIDKPDVRTVVHFDLPSSLEEYYQEAGRAGRDGKPSYAVVIAARTDKGLLTRRLNDAFPSKAYIADVYDKACVFLDIAVGAGYNEIFDFDFNLFCKRFDLQPTTAFSALKILTRAGYIEFVDEVQARSRVMITADKREFYSLQLDAVTDSIFAALQRSYTGLFADYVPIDEGRLARTAEVTEQQVYEAMLMLSRLKVLSYIPKKDTPYLYMSTSREESRYLVLSKAVYEDRRASMEQRISAMKSFVFDSTACRSATLLQYFGEKEAQPCGRCDVCRAAAASRPDETQLRGTLLYLASRPGGCDIAEAIATARAPRQYAVETIRYLSDRGELTVADGRICLPK